MTRWAKQVAARNEAIALAGRWRVIRPFQGGGPVLTMADGTEAVSFASNDYLGLSQHPAVRCAAVAAIERWGTGAGSARLVAGDRPVHHDLEAAIAEWKRTEAALLFSTGYAANLGVLSALGTDGVLVVSDERNHASIVDGCRLSKARVAISRHADVGHVDELVSAHDGPAIVVTDTVFSMDGDIADLPGLGAVCGEAGALLVLDEAHDVLGPAWTPPDGLDVLRVGTLSKTLGSLGGFAAGSRAFIDLLINAARSFIFTTAPSPADIAAAAASLAVLRSPYGIGLVDRLRSHVGRIQPGHTSPIVPVVIGGERAVLAAAERLLADHRLVVPAIRPPTVAPGTSRLRIALSAAHTDDHVDRLTTALAGI